MVEWVFQMQADDTQLRGTPSAATLETDYKQQQQPVSNLVFAQPMDELDASDTEAEKVAVTAAA